MNWPAAGSLEKFCTVADFCVSSCYQRAMQVKVVQGCHVAFPQCSIDQEHHTNSTYILRSHNSCMWPSAQCDCCTCCRLHSMCKPCRHCLRQQHQQQVWALALDVATLLHHPKEGMSTTSEGQKLFIHCTADQASQAMGGTNLSSVLLEQQ